MLLAFSSKELKMLLPLPRKTLLRIPLTWLTPIGHLCMLVQNCVSLACILRHTHTCSQYIIIFSMCSRMFKCSTHIYVYLHIHNNNSKLFLICLLIDIYAHICVSVCYILKSTYEFILFFLIK